MLRSRLAVLMRLVFGYDIINPMRCNMILLRLLLVSQDTAVFQWLLYYTIENIQIFMVKCIVYFSI
jgi:hypothetical protein